MGWGSEEVESNSPGLDLDLDLDLDEGDQKIGMQVLADGHMPELLD